MRRSDHPSGFSSFDAETFSLAKLIIIIVAYHHKCAKIVIIVKDTMHSNSHVRLDCSHPCPHQSLQQQLTHFEAPPTMSGQTALKSKVKTPDYPIHEY
jgi:hypothetical protein